MADRQKGVFRAYVGTYTAKESRGIHLLRFDASSGGLEVVGLAAEMPNPTFLAMHPEGRFLYAVSEVRDERGRHDGAVNAFACNPGTGELTFLGKQSSHGDGPCHVSVDHTGRVALVANYVSGTVAMLPIRDDGSLGEATDAVQHEGSSAHPERQAGPHAHFITPSPDNRFALVADLGLDRIMIYRLDLAAGRLRPNDPPWAALRSGAGPRHLAFHPALPIVYVINELDNTLTAFSWDAARGALTEVRSITTLPSGFQATNFPAHVQSDPSGRVLYGSNRGHDSIAVFRLDADGIPSAPTHCPTQGLWPRHFSLDPTGAWLLAANQNSDSIIVLRRHADTGLMSPTGHRVEVSIPVCVAFVERE